MDFALPWRISKNQLVIQAFESLLLVFVFVFATVAIFVFAARILVHGS